MVRVRFAPSPTGNLHIGSARTALFNYLFARQQKGTYILRIEDTDIDRNLAQAAEQFMDCFKWLGLEWDEGPGVGGEYGPYSSLERLPLYQPYIDQLLQTKQAYYCYCSKEELEQFRTEATEAKRPYRYPGKCRDLAPETIALYEQEGRPRTIRFRIPDNLTVTFTDLIREQVTFNTADIGDFIIVKQNGVPVYNLAATLDDILMKITHVIRGEEHLSNTLPQILLYQAFAADLPQFAHLPLILNQTGKKLSKRDESLLQFIDQYRQLGYLPEAINNYLALLGWSPPAERGEEEIFTLEELIGLFSFERIGKAGAIFDPQKLRWVNEAHLRKLPLDQLLEVVRPYLEEYYPALCKDESWHRSICELYTGSIGSLSELAEDARCFCVEELSYTDEASNLVAENRELLASIKTKFAEVNGNEWTATSLAIKLKEVQNESGLKGKALFWPLRAAATGQLGGPDLKKSLELLGKNVVLSRLN